MSGRCIVKVRGTVAKGDTLVLSDYKGMLVTDNAAAFENVKALALTTNSATAWRSGVCSSITIKKS